MVFYLTAIPLDSLRRRGGTCSAHCWWPGKGASNSHDTTATTMVFQPALLRQCRRANGIRGKPKDDACKGAWSWHVLSLGWLGVCRAGQGSAWFSWSSPGVMQHGVRPQPLQNVPEDPELYSCPGVTVSPMGRAALRPTMKAHAAGWNHRTQRH